MNNPYERINDIVFNLQNKKYNSALTLIIPLIDRSAKDTYAIRKVGERFKKLINDNKDFIFWFGSGCVINVTNEININGKTLPDIFYNMVRNCLVHDAELTNVEFIEGNTIISLDGQKIKFSINFIYSLFVFVCYLPCNANKIPKGITMNNNRIKIDIDNICGKGKIIAFEEIIKNKTNSATQSIQPER